MLTRRLEWAVNEREKRDSRFDLADASFFATFEDSNPTLLVTKPYNPAIIAPAIRQA